jgi:hypothetical protein
MVADQPLGHTAGFVASLALDHDLPGDLHAAARHAEHSDR